MRFVNVEHQDLVVSFLSPSRPTLLTSCAIQRRCATWCFVICNIGCADRRLSFLSFFTVQSWYQILHVNPCLLADVCLVSDLEIYPSRWSYLHGGFAADYLQCRSPILERTIRDQGRSPQLSHGGFVFVCGLAGVSVLRHVYHLAQLSRMNGDFLVLATWRCDSALSAESSNRARQWHFIRAESSSNGSSHTRTHPS